MLIRLTNQALARLFSCSRLTALDRLNIAFIRVRLGFPNSRLLLQDACTWRRDDNAGTYAVACAIGRWEGSRKIHLALKEDLKEVFQRKKDSNYKSSKACHH